MKKCPYNIDIKSVHNGKIQHVDCTLCGECVAACSTNALNIGVCKPTRSKVWNIVPAILTIALIAFGIWAGGKFELPTIDMEWGIENVAEDGTVTQLVDPAKLETTTIDGLRSVKCYGSSMAFKAKLEKIAGVHGVKVYVRRHAADILFDPAKTNKDKIQEAIYVPSKFRVNTPDHQAVPELKVVTIRTEGMYDKMDINYLGMQMRNTGKKIYGLETEFACPLIVRVYMDPSENLDKDWYEDVVEMEVLQMPVHGGGMKEIEVDYEFVKVEDEVKTISTVDFLKKMFSPFKAQFKKRVEENEGKEQFVYEIANANYEKPIYLRNMPFLSNHLSKHDGIIGVYLNLNKDLVPAIQIRYAEPMTAEKIWELITMDTWTITYKKDDVREEGAKIAFKEQGVVYNYSK
jgi:ferredoxin